MNNPLTENKSTHERIYQDLETFVENNSLSSKAVSENFEFISAGAAKEVYDLNNGYVAKIAPKYICDVHNEIEVYSKSSDSIKSFLLPILLSKSEVNLAFQPLVNPVKFRDLVGFLNEQGVPMERINLISNGIYQIAEEFGLVYSDLKRCQNWGELNGEYYLIDYGMKVDFEYDEEDEE